MVNFGNVNVILDLIFVIITFSIIDTIFIILEKKTSLIYLCVTEIVVLLSWMFNLWLLEYIFVSLWGIGILFFCYVNRTQIKFLLSNGFKTKNGKISSLFKKNNEKIEPEVLIDREKVYKEVADAVIVLSRQKIGALITFERHDKLDEIMKNGTQVDAPLTSELLQTIFYPGTRLHDGAVVVKDDKIVAASVYFTPTKRPLFGKFGSRHRAAFGISEVSDSVTVVVSEETGRISIAFQGELTPVTPDTFLRVFEEFMNYSTPTASNSKKEE